VIAVSPGMRNALAVHGAARVLVYLKEPVQEPPRAFTGRRALLAAGNGAGGHSPRPYFYRRLGVVLGTATRETISALRHDERVRAIGWAPPIRPIRPVGAARTVSPEPGATWGIEALQVPALWKQGLTGKGVRVGHLDTGVDARHPALKGAVVAFTEFDELGRERRSAAPHDSDMHGTHTAATIAGRAVAGAAVGVAPGAGLCSALVIEGGDVVARVLGGMDWAVGQGIRVLSMSLGFPGWWADFLPLTRILRARGVLPVFAIGNEGPGTSRSPGNYPEALSVGAIRQRPRSVAAFSSSERFRRAKDPAVPDLVAPGVNTISASPGRAWAALSGTSMATPHIAGLAALLFEAHPRATVDSVEKAIFAACARIAGERPDRQGRGVPSAIRALEAVRQLGG